MNRSNGGAGDKPGALRGPQSGSVANPEPGTEMFHPPEVGSIPPDLAETIVPTSGDYLEPETNYLGPDFEPAPPTGQAPPRNVTHLDLDTLPSQVRSLIDNVELKARPVQEGIRSNSRPMLGPYILLGRLGHDDLSPPEMENAVEVRKVAAPRRVVLRRMHPDDSKHRIRRLRFRAEADAAAALEHRHLVRVYEDGEQKGVPYLVREFVRGMNARGLARDGRVSLARAIAVAAQVTDALAYATDLEDERGRPVRFVHGAICPEAILIGLDGLSRLTEMGLATLDGRWLDPLTDARRGKPGYVAPEQVRGGRLGPQTDLFSLGIVLLELIDGHRPDWQAAPESWPELVRAICRVRQVPSQLTALLSRMTMLRFDKRLGDASIAAEVCEDLLRDASAADILRDAIPDMGAEADDAEQSDDVDSDLLDTLPGV